MTPTELAERILWLGIEGPTGLWEILWELQLPADNQTIAMIGGVVEQLLDEGYVGLYEEHDPRDPLRPLTAEDGASALRAERNWFEPSVGATCVRFETTSLGQSRYWGQLPGKDR